MVELILSAHKERKKSKTKTLNPVWANEMRRIPIVHWALPNLLVFRVISNNDIGLRELGICSIRIKDYKKGERYVKRLKLENVLAGWIRVAITVESSHGVPLNRFSSNVSIDDESIHNPQTRTQQGDCSPHYVIRENSIRVICTISGSKVALKCMIRPTPRNFGLNCVKALLNGALLWKKHFGWYNSWSSREFTVGDDVKLIAEWHVSLRTNWDDLAPNDPRRNESLFCIGYLALKDENGASLTEYRGDKTPLLDKSLSRKP